MSFMEPEIIECEYVYVDGSYGVEIIPAHILAVEGVQEAIKFLETEPTIDVPDCLSDYCQNRSIYSIQIRFGIIARLSAPGYLDFTEWSEYANVKEAKKALADYENDDDVDYDVD